MKNKDKDRRFRQAVARITPYEPVLLQRYEPPPHARPNRCYANVHRQGCHHNYDHQ
jgi:hypothetical protein